MNQSWIGGAIAVKAALLGGQREVFQIIIFKEKLNRDFKYIIKEAEKRAVKVLILNQEDFFQFPEAKTAAGIIAEVGPYIFPEFDYFNLSGWFVYLQGVEDPFNFAYCLRSLYAAGCSGVLVDPRNWLTASDTIIRSSAGASEYLPIYQVGPDTLKNFITKDYQVIAAQRNADAVSLTDFIFPEKFLLVFGGEKRGISKEVLNQTSKYLYIKYQRDFKMALNASSAVSVFAFTISKQLDKGEI